MNTIDSTPPTRRAGSRGFTLLEILMVVAIIGLLAAVALPQYRSYTARSQATDLALKYDAVRTNFQVAAKTGDVQGACINLVSGIQITNLHSDYAQLAVSFEPVTGGFTPVLTMCADLSDQGPHGVEVTREAHHLLSRNSVISQGAVIGDSAVSFSVKLAGDAALCQTLPPAGTNKASCSPSAGKGTQTSASLNGAVVPASGPASQPAVLPGVVANQNIVQVSAAVSQPAKPQGTVPNPPALAALQPSSQPISSGQNACPAGPPRQVSRQVMGFGRMGTGAVYPTTYLDTHGNMRSFSAEVAIAGGPGSGNNPPGATLLSYATPSSPSEFALSNPHSLHLQFAGRVFDTGINVDDQQSHRLTVSWESGSGTLLLYDNGQRVWRGSDVNRGGSVGGNGILVIGQGHNPRGDISMVNGYAGHIVSASLGNEGVTASQVRSSPLHNVLQANNGLITNVVMGPDGHPTDTTGRASYIANGDVGAQNAMVSTAVFVDTNCK